MAKTMHAAVVVEFGKPLVFRDYDIPSPGPGQILVKTEACGVCHTDLHAANGDWPVKPTPPFTPGHEGIGLAVLRLRPLRILLDSLGDGLRRS
jgi:propanol-preferring alcohol dehydrogenase